MSRDRRAAAVAELLGEIRELSAEFDSLSLAVADRLGLGITDLLAMDLISRHTRVTAGQIGERLHMTSGAITGMIDRLERAGLAQRIADSHDRRRVLVIPTVTGNQIGQLFDPLATALEAATSNYTDAEVTLLSTFLGQIRGAVTKAVVDLSHG